MNPILYVYAVCAAGMFILLEKRLQITDRKTNKPIKTKEATTLLLIFRILVSITWLVSIPLLLQKAEQ